MINKYIIGNIPLCPKMIQAHIYRPTLPKWFEYSELYCGKLIHTTVIKPKT